LDSMLQDVKQLLDRKFFISELSTLMTLASMHFAAPMKLVPQSERINLSSPRKATKRRKALMSHSRHTYRDHQ
jgi:hypothetical protein